MKVYGESRYVGYVIRRNRETKKAVSKHYISAVDNSLFTNNKVNITIRDKNGDKIIPYYEVGSNKYLDNAIRSWHIARKKMENVLLI